MATTEFHTDTSRRFIEQAEDELRRGDGLQASEKAWGAAAHAVKSVAELHDWPHERHGHLYDAIFTIRDSTGDKEIETLFRLAGGLHQNFYEGWYDQDAIATGITEVKRLIAKLDAVYPDLGLTSSEDTNGNRP